MLNRCSTSATTILLVLGKYAIADTGHLNILSVSHKRKEVLGPANAFVSQDQVNCEMVDIYVDDGYPSLAGWGRVLENLSSSGNVIRRCKSCHPETLENSAGSPMMIYLLDLHIRVQSDNATTVHSSRTDKLCCSGRCRSGVGLKLMLEFEPAPLCTLPSMAIIQPKTRQVCVLNQGSLVICRCPGDYLVSIFTEI